MNNSQFWTAKVNEAMLSGRITHAQAWNTTARIYPDAAILMRAVGQTRRAVQFFNSKIPRGSVTPAQREQGKQFANEVQAEMKRDGCTYGVAYNHLAAKHPQFANGQKNDLSRFANDAGGTPTPSPQLMKLFRLPMDTTSAEWATAWAANLETASPINFGKIFDALCELVQKEKSQDYAAALIAAKSRFPDLWAAVEELSKVSV